MNDQFSSKTTFLDLVKNAKENPLLLSNKKIYDHIIKYVDRSYEWALFQREDLLTRGNDTNNYAEATMRIIKDKVLGRVKAFNPVQLVDFLVTRFPAYIEMRITDVLNNRSLNPFQSRYFIRPEKLENLVTEKLPNLPHCYKVTNKAKGTAYIVLMENELCSCPEGKSGKQCKHQCAVVKNYKLPSAQFLPREQTGTEIKLALFEILHGHRKVPSGWFCGLHDYLENNSPEADASSNTVSSLTYDSETTSQEDPNQEIPNPASSSDVELPNPEDVLAAEEKLKEMFSGWLQNLKNRPAVFLDPVNVMLKSNNKIKDSDSGLVSAFMTFGKSGGTKPLSVKRLIQCTIPAQSTAKSRRKVHLGGCHAQTGRRPLLASLPPATQENNYQFPPKRKSNESHWAIISKRKYPAPHSVSLCVSTNRMIGSNHSKKN
ncbi:hypothetical protein FOCC_FOCC006591 [Frankliniella occidentalis]|nr:hypothetical protein FOCC_FOCC006591 [Frankliniella occidentalis]